MLKRNYLSAIESVAQAIGTMGPAATLGTIIPLLISKSGNGTWLLCLGVLGIFILISLTINIFASRRASAGSLATYAQMGLGRWAGVFAGWSYFIAMVFVITSSGISSAYYFSKVIFRLTSHPVGLPGSILLTTVILAVAWWPGYRDVKLSTKVMLAVEALSVTLILAILFMAVSRSHQGWDRPQLLLHGTNLGEYRLGLVLAFMMLAGFESTTALGEETKSATRTIPRVMLLCLIPVGLIYVLSAYGLTTLSHLEKLSLDQSDSPLDLIAVSIGLPALGWISSVGVGLSCFGCALGGFNAGSRVLFHMAQDHYCWRGFGLAHPVHGTPHRALILLGIIGLLLPAGLLACGVSMPDAMDFLMEIASFGFIGGYFTVCLAAPFFLAREKALNPGRVLISVVTLSVIAVTLFQTVFPIPNAPWLYLPYIFFGLIGSGMIGTWFCLKRRSLIAVEAV